MQQKFPATRRVLIKDCIRAYELVKGVLYNLIKYNLSWSHEPLVISGSHVLGNVTVTGVLAPTVGPAVR